MKRKLRRDLRELKTQFTVEWIETPIGRDLVKAAFPEGFTTNDLTLWLDACKEFQQYYEQHIGAALDALERSGKVYRIGDRYYATPEDHSRP